MQKLIESISASIKKMESGNLKKEDMDDAIYALRDLEERLVILRYKLYESELINKNNAKDTQEAPIEASNLNEAFELNFDQETEIDSMPMKPEELPVKENTKKWEVDVLNEQEKQVFRIVRIIQNNRNPVASPSFSKLFMLNEKLMFINELFEGSSESFANAIKRIDNAQNIIDATRTVASLCNQFHWDVEGEVFEEFIYKICCRHA